MPTKIKLPHEYIPIEHLKNINLIKLHTKSLRKLDLKNFVVWYDRIDFPTIVFIWTIIIFLFGVSYYAFSSDISFLQYTNTKTMVTNFYDAIYFSFITATTTGFGDVVPHGTMKVIAIIEVAFGLILIALVTSKLVSIKQDIILKEIFEMSINSQINRMRSSLLLFRQNITRLITNIEEGTIKKK